MPGTQEEAIAFIKKVKCFGETELGIDFCGSFEEVEEKAAHCYWLHVSHPHAVKNALRKRLHIFSKREEAILQAVDKYKSAGFDTHVFRGEAYSGHRCPIFPSLLVAPRSRQADVVLHEGAHNLLWRNPLFHRNCDLDESVAALIGHFGAVSFAEYIGDKVLGQQLCNSHDWWIQSCHFISWAINELSTAYRTCSPTDLPDVRNDILARIIETGIASQVLGENREELYITVNNAYFLRTKNYTVLYPLMLGVHQAFDSDIKKTMQFLLSLPPKRKEALAAVQTLVGNS